MALFTSGEKGVTEAPAGSVRRSEWMLADVIGVEALQAIQDAFARAFGLPTVIVDRSGRNITEITHRVAFCDDLTRTSPGGVRCAACDADAMRRAEASGSPAIFHCWNRLYDCAIPIASSDGRLFGHFLCGQIFMAPEPAEGYRSVARELGIDEDSYVAAAREIRVVDREDFERSVEAMGVLATMIADQASASMQNLAVLEQALEAKAATDRLTRELDTIVEASGAIAAAGDTLPTIERIADSIERVIPCDSCIIFELESPGTQLRPLAVRDPYVDAITEWRAPIGTGIPGLVAKSGAALRLDDVRADPRFVPIPGVPVEPEAILAVPMLFNGEVRGVITVSRFQQRTFTDHELDVLKILAAQSAIALATAAFREQVARRLEAERMQVELARRMSAGGPLRALLDDVVATAYQLLSCSAAAIRTDSDELAHPSPIGISDRSVQGVARARAEERERARTAGRAVQCDHETGSLLVAPLQSAGRPVGELLLLRPERFSESDERLAETLAQHAGAATENARIERSRRRLETGYTLLAELGAEIAASDSEGAIVQLVARRAHELVGGGSAFVAIPAPSSEIDVWLRASGRPRRCRVPTAGHPRLRLPQPASEQEGFREELLDAWSSAIAEALPVPAAKHAVAAPLLAAGGGLTGAVVVMGERAFGPEEHRMLAALAHMAASALAARHAEAETDDVLAARADGLAMLTELGQRITAAHDTQSAAAVTLSSVREIAGVTGAALVTRHGDVPEVTAAVGFSRSRAARLLAGLPEDAWDAVEPVRTDTSLAVPLLLDGRTRGLIVAAAPAHDPNSQVLMALASYSAIALDSAGRLEHERRSLAEARELHRGSIEQAGELERSLTIQRAISEAVLERASVTAVTETLARLQGGRVAIYDADMEPIAGFPDPPADDQPIAELLASHRAFDASAPLQIDLAEGQTLLAMPIRAEGERLGWVVQQLSRAPSEVDRVAIAHAGTAVALAMLRARTAEEVAARMRGEFLQSLLAGEGSPEELVRRGHALTYDLTQPSRVAVVAAANESPEITERLYREAIRWARRVPGQVFIAKRGNELTALGPGSSDWPTALNDALTVAVGPVLMGVGPVADAPAEYRQSFLDARQCVRGLRALGRDGVLSLEGDGLEQLLLRATDSERLIAFASRYVVPLQEHDARGHSPLITTLDLVFEHGWNLRAAARAAHVHVSTLRYRLSRVEALAEVDLHRPDDRLALQLALRTSRLLMASGRWPRPELHQS